MMNDRRPILLAEAWREEFEKFLASLLPENEEKFVLTDLYTILNFLSKVAKEFEYHQQDKIF